MKQILLISIALLITAPNAAAPKNRVGIVDIEKAVASVSGSSSYINLRKVADADLAKRQKTLNELLAKANSTGTQANIAEFKKYQQEFVKAQESYRLKLGAAFKPLADKVDKAVASVAKSSGYSVVLDKNAAARSRLVVYADLKNADLTEAVKKAIK